MHTYACFKQILRIKTYHYNKKFWLFQASDIVHLLPCYENNFRMLNISLENKIFFLITDTELNCSATLKLVF